MTVDTGVAARIDALHKMTVKELRRRWAEVFGEEAPNGHKQYLIKRLAWRIQANAEGDISERARRRAEELADDSDLRVKAPRAASRRGRVAPHDSRIAFRARFALVVFTGAVSNGLGRSCPPVNSPTFPVA